MIECLQSCGMLILHISNEFQKWNVDRTCSVIFWCNDLSRWCWDEAIDKSYIGSFLWMFWFIFENKQIKFRITRTIFNISLSATVEVEFSHKNDRKNLNNQHKMFVDNFLSISGTDRLCVFLCAQILLKSTKERTFDVASNEIYA